MRQVQVIRAEFDELRVQVAQWPEGARPPEAAFEIDPQLRQLAEERAAVQEEQVGCGLAQHVLLLARAASSRLNQLEHTHAHLKPACSPLLPPLLQVYAELSWDLERAALQLDKLQAFFLAEVEAEHAMLHGFRSGACLASFRLLALPQGLQQRLATLAAQVRAEAARAAAGAELVAAAGAGAGGRLCIGGRAVVDPGAACVLHQSAPTHPCLHTWQAP